jgi:hypothetical protein
MIVGQQTCTIQQQCSMHVCRLIAQTKDTHLTVRLIMLEHSATRTQLHAPLLNTRLYSRCRTSISHYCFRWKRVGFSCKRKDSDNIGRMSRHTQEHSLTQTTCTSQLLTNTTHYMQPQNPHISISHKSDK